MNERIPKSSSGDEDHPEVSQTECSSIDYHPHQRHEVDSEGCLPGKTHEKYTTLNHHYHDKEYCLRHFQFVLQ